MLGILLMGGLLFVKYLYLPKHEELNVQSQSIKAAEQKKKELQQLIAAAQSKLEKTRAALAAQEEEGGVEPVKGQPAPEVGETALDQLLANLFMFGDLEQVTPLRVKPYEIQGGETPLEFTVKGRFEDTLAFLKQATTLPGIGGLSSIVIEDARVETHRWVVTTTVVFPARLSY